MDKTPLNYALAYAALDWKVFPCWWVNDDKTCGCGNAACKNVGKHPISELAPKGQNSATTDKDTITQWWGKYPQANIAIFLAGSGLCAVDIDPRNGGDYTIEVLESEHGKIDSDVLQLTGGGGEHRVFLLPSGDVKLPGTLGKGVDFKSNGYIIAEPSNHVSGQSYVWEMSSDPLAGAVPSPLPDWIRSFNVNAAHASNETGTLHNGMSDNQYYDVLEALQFIGSDDRDTWLNVGMALQASGDKRAYQMWCDWSQASSKFDQNDQYRVWRSFKGKGLGSIDLPTIFKLAQDNGWVNSNAKLDALPVIEANEEISLNEKLAKKNSAKRVPSELLTFPVAILNEVADWVEGFSREPQRQITMQGVISLASVICGRLYQSTEGNTSSLYLLTLGDTGIGKNYIKTSVQQALVEMGFSNMISGSGNTSHGAVFSAMIDAPCHIQIMDEIGKHLQTARKQQNGQIAEAFSTLVEVYSSTTSLMIPKNYSNMGRKKSDRVSKQEQIVHSPSVTLSGLATPGQVYENLSTKEIEDGFLNRFIVVDITEPQSPRQKSRRVPLPSHIVEWGQSIRHLDPKTRTDLTGVEVAHNMIPTFTVVEFDDIAMDIFDDFYDHLKECEAKGEFKLPDLTRRWVENAMRMATMLAVCADCENPVITAELADWSIKYVSFYGQAFIEQVSAKVADTEFHRLYLAVYDLIKRSEGNGMTERDLATFSRLFAASMPAQRDQVFKALLSEERVMQVAVNSASGRGRKRVCFILPQYFNVSSMVEQN